MSDSENGKQDLPFAWQKVQGAIWLVGLAILAWQDWWSRMSESGVCGDPTVATAEFGRALLETTVENFFRFVREFRTIPLRPRRDLHARDAAT